MTGKRVSSGRHPGDELRLAPFGSLGPHVVGAGRARYDATAAGDTVCVDPHAGALGLRWLPLPPCP